MNIFYENQDILGKEEIAHWKNTLQKFFDLAGTIRNQLGNQSYLLDKYLHDVLTAINSTLAYDAASDGFEMTSELLHLCNKITQGEAVDETHPLYQKTKEYIDSHPLPCQEHSTKVSFYCIGLNDAFLEYAVPKFIAERKDMIRSGMDIVYVRQLYRKISTLLGNEEQMERLNLLIRQRFMMVPAVAGFVQGATNSLLYSLTARDVESGRTVMQLWLDK